MSDAPAASTRNPRYLLHIALFLATFLTTTADGAIYAHVARQGDGFMGWGAIFPIADGLSYSVPLLLILICHEFGHYFTARAYGVDASLPYFIPLPPGVGLGTLGAVIGMRDVTSDRRQLIDIGAAGPLCGLIVAIPVILYGLSLSAVGTLAGDGVQEGNSILYAVLKYISKGEWLPGGGRDVFIHPTARAGWAGLLVTMINLLPMGQLDGGHIATAYYGNRYDRFAQRMHRALPVIALLVFGWVLYLVHQESGARWDRALGVSIATSAAVPWIVWFVLVGVIRRISGGVNHPPVNEQPLPRSRKILFWVVVAAFVSVFMPVPLRMTVAPVPPVAPAAATVAPAP